MRKSRGLTLVDLAAQAGVSLSSVKKLEASADEVNLLPTTLDAILTAMAMHAPLGPSEIGQLSKSVGRQYESLERLNDQAQRRLRAANASPTPTKRDEPTLEERLQHAVHLLVAAGMGETVLVQLEALAELHGQRIADQERTPRKRRFQVHHPERQVGDLTVQDISHYEVDDEDDRREPRQLRPIDEPKSPAIDPADDTDSNNNTGS